MSMDEVENRKFTLAEADKGVDVTSNCADHSMIALPFHPFEKGGRAANRPPEVVQTTQSLIWIESTEKPLKVYSPDVSIICSVWSSPSSA